MIEITDDIDQNSQKITAEEVRSNCPATLQNLGDQITAHWKAAH
jgi:hypothetical protein